MARGKRAQPEAEKPRAAVEVLKCKHCRSELKRTLFDSRAKKPLYLYVCDKGNCPLYRQPQKYDGELPQGINIAIA